MGEGHVSGAAGQRRYVTGPSKTYERPAEQAKGQVDWSWVERRASGLLTSDTGAPGHSAPPTVLVGLSYPDQTLLQSLLKAKVFGCTPPNIEDWRNPRGLELGTQGKVRRSDSWPGLPTSLNH